MRVIVWEITLVIYIVIFILHISIFDKLSKLDKIKKEVAKHTTTMTNGQRRFLIVTCAMGWPYMFFQMLRRSFWQMLVVLFLAPMFNMIGLADKERARRKKEKKAGHTPCTCALCRKQSSEATPAEEKS